MDIDIDLLRRHVQTLSSVPRPAESPALEKARRYATHLLEASGWRIERHPFEDIGAEGARLQGVNLIARHRNDPGPESIRFCVGAHLDSRPETPGADDNGSAVAALLELARIVPALWADVPRAPLSLELLLFDLEENGMLGGAAHARRHQESRIDLRGMISLEMLGYCDHRPGTQQVPPLLEELAPGRYPTTGNFIALVGNENSIPLLRTFERGMRAVPELLVETVAVPENGEVLPPTRLSDHSPFWDAGYPALMITDTSFLRNPYYHTPGDTWETLDFEFLARVAQGVVEAVRNVLRDGLPPAG